MTVGKWLRTVLLLICVLCLLGACGQQTQPAITAVPESTPVPAAEPTAEPTPEPARTAELLHVCNEENNEYCLAAAEDGTRFLIARWYDEKYDLWVQNEDGSGRTDLAFVGLSEEDAEAIYGLSGRAFINPFQSSGMSREDTLQKHIESMKSQYGSIAEGLIHWIWYNLKPDYVTVAGEFALVSDPQVGVTARVNMRTGETVMLFRLFCIMSGNGTILAFGNGTIQALGTDTGSGRPSYLLRPDRTVPEEADYVLSRDAISLPGCLSLQEDGTLWVLETRSENSEVDGEELFLLNVSVAHYAPDGTELRRISGGVFEYSACPQVLLYSEQTGTGIVYNPSGAYNPPYIFGPEDDTMKPLMPESLIPPVLRRGEREEVVDEYGRMLRESDVRRLLVLGMSRGGTKLLVQDLQSGYLLSLDLATLKADILLNDAQIVSFVRDHMERPGSLMYNMGWNNGEIISCGPAVRGYAFRIPFRDAD